MASLRVCGALTWPHAVKERHEGQRGGTTEEGGSEEEAALGTSKKAFYSPPYVKT